DDASTFQPEHEVSVRRHIGDYTMFMTGVFRERVERLASHAFYVAQGKRAYHFVSEHARATQRAAPYRRLAEHFESLASALDYTARAHSPAGAGPRFFGLAFECLRTPSRPTPPTAGACSITGWPRGRSQAQPTSSRWLPCHRPNSNRRCGRSPASAEQPLSPSSRLSPTTRRVHYVALPGASSIVSPSAA